MVILLDTLRHIPQIESLLLLQLPKSSMISYFVMAFQLTYTTIKAKKLRKNTVSCLGEILWYDPIKISPYQPAGNGQVERLNRTLLGMPCTMSEIKKSRWKDYLTKVTHTYNCTRHSSTGFAPFFLLFGQSP